MIDVFHHFTHHHNPTVEKYIKIHEKSWIRAIDKYIYVITTMGIVMTLPQIWDIWVKQNASGVSIISWSAYLISASIWTAYGLGHKEKILVFTNVSWVVLDLAIIIGVFLYG